LHDVLSNNTPGFLKMLEMKKTKVSLLGYDGAIKWQTTGDSIRIQPPAVNPATIPCDYAWVFKIFDVLGPN
jgi:alpha-L-fucosidase